MNGSMAWYNGKMKVLFSDNVKIKVRACVVMGGVEIDKGIETLSSVPKVLNRFSLATMNQLYHAGNTAKFFNDFKEKLYFVTNNEINAKFNWSKDKSDKAFQTFKNDFNKYMGVYDLPPLEKNNKMEKLFTDFYRTRPIARKPFDVISAHWLSDYIINENFKLKNENENFIIEGQKKLIFDNKYGITIIHDDNDCITKVNKVLDEKIAKNQFGKKGFEAERTTVETILNPKTQKTKIIKMNKTDSVTSEAAAAAPAGTGGGGKKSKKTAAPEKTYLPYLHKCPDGRSRKAFRVKGKGNTIYVVYKGVVTAVKKIK